MKQMVINSTTNCQLHAEHTDTIEGFLRNIRKFPVPSAAEENNLLRKYHETHDINIRNYLVCCHQRFVYSAAKKYTIDPELVMDLVSEGNLGLIEAIEKFNPDEHDNKLITYAQSYIRRNMNFYISKSKTVRRDSDTKIGSRLSSERSLFFNEHGRLPVNEEIRDIMETKYGIKNINDIDLEISTFISCDTSYKSHGNNVDGGNALFMGDDEFVERTSSYNLYEQLIDEDYIKSTVLAALQTLDEREQDILKMLYGIDYPEGIDPDIIGEKYGITRTRIFQIKNQALKKMKYEIPA